MNFRLESHFRSFCRRGDAAALGKVFDATSAELFSVACRLVGDTATAEDVVQQTYLTAIEKAHQFDDGQRVMPWLVGILARHAAKARAAKGRAPDPRRIDSREPSDPSVDAQRAEIDEVIHDEINGLPESYACVVRPLLEHGAGPADIAKTLGMTANAVSLRIHRGLKILRKRLPSGAAPAIVLAAPNMALMRSKVVSAAGSAGTGAMASAAAVSTGTSLGASAATGLLGTQQIVLWAAAGACLGSVVTHQVHRWSDAATEPPLIAAGDPITRTVTDAEDRSPQLAALSGGQTVAAAEASPPSSRVEANQAADWLARINGARRVSEATEIFVDLARLEESAGLGVMEEIFSGVEKVSYRAAALRTFAREEHSFTHRVLHLGVEDSAPLVQAAAFDLLKRIAFIGFAEDFTRYESWREQQSARTYAEVINASAEDFAKRVRAASGEPLFLLFQEFWKRPDGMGRAAGVDVAAVLVQAGILEDVRRLMTLPEDASAVLAFRWARALGSAKLFAEDLEDIIMTGSADEVSEALEQVHYVEVREDFLRSTVLDIVRSRGTQHSEVLSGAISVLGQPGNEFAIDPLLDLLRESVDAPKDRSRVWDCARALARIGDPRVIPAMISAIRADNTYDTVYGVGYFGLGKLTGVDYDESHDGNWWVNWWASNRARLAPEVRNMGLPY